MTTITKMNPDMVKERANATVDVEKLKVFLGELNHMTPSNYQKYLHHRKALVEQIKPIGEENFHNLGRQEKYDMIYDKTIKLIEYNNLHQIDEIMQNYLFGAVLAYEKPAFNLHYTMFRDAIEVWGTPEQAQYWKEQLERNAIFGTYVQTELGHGTYLRGLETTATYDKKTREFVIDSPTLTSIKFWPGSSGKSSNYAIVMAKMIIEGEDCGIHAFLVQLRSLDDHRPVPGIEMGDIGRKFANFGHNELGFDTTDNGYVKFNKLRIPRTNMLMRFARVSEDGKFERFGNELLMYAAMLLMRGSLPLLASYYLSISTTIAIRYSCVRRQTANTEGVEQQIIEYQTQQYRLFPALAASYASYFTSWYLKSALIKIRNETNNFKDASSKQLAQLHAVVSGLKAVLFGDCLKFAQSNRLCCGGHGYSAASGLPQIVQDSDAGCTYEGDNVVLLLQTARYLLKCAQKNISPHFDIENFGQWKSSKVFNYFDSTYLAVLSRLYDDWMGRIGSKLLNLVQEQGVPELTAWNQCSQDLISIARVYINIFIINASLDTLLKNNVAKNQEALSDLLELYILYNICENYSGILLSLQVIDGDKMTEFKEKLFSLLQKIRVNALALVDAFDYMDSNLCSALGVYDGNVYERLFDFAKKSKFNEKEVHDAYHKYLKPYSLRLKQTSKL